MSLSAISWAFSVAIKPAATKFVLVALANECRSGGAECWPSVAGIAKATGLDRKTVMASILRLEDAKLIAIIRADGRGNRYILKTENKPKSEDETSTENGTATSTENGTGNESSEPVPKTGPPSTKNGTTQYQKRDTNQEITRKYPGSRTPTREKQKKSAEKKQARIPDGIDASAWRDFDAYRNSSAKLKRGWSDIAKTKAANLLRTLSAQLQRECVDYSIIGGYTGLFPERLKNATRQRATNRAEQFFDACKEYAEQDAGEVDSEPVCQTSGAIRPQVV